MRIRLLMPLVNLGMPVNPGFQHSSDFYHNIEIKFTPRHISVYVRYENYLASLVILKVHPLLFLFPSPSLPLSSSPAFPPSIQFISLPLFPFLFEFLYCSFILSRPWNILVLSYVAIFCSMTPSSLLISVFYQDRPQTPMFP